MNIVNVSTGSFTPHAGHCVAVRCVAASCGMLRRFCRDATHVIRCERTLKGSASYDECSRLHGIPEDSNTIRSPDCTPRTADIGIRSRSSVRRILPDTLNRPNTSHFCVSQLAKTSSRKAFETAQHTTTLATGYRVTLQCDL